VDAGIEMKLRLQNISLPLTHFTLTVDVEISGNAIALCGPSGAGKTSLLDLIAGLRHAPAALIQLDDQVLTDTSRKLFIPARKRGIGYVPQDLALFPHLNVRQNILYGHKPGGASNDLFSLAHVTDILKIEPLIARNVVSLSGGEKQRVALARALLTSPRLLLLDEPLASLDANLKARILPYLARVRDEFRIPMLYVTHDVREVAALCDEMFMMDCGKIIRSGSVAELASAKDL